MSKFLQTEVRLSEVARGCHRMSYYRSTGEQPTEPDSEQHEWFARGNLFEQYVVQQLRAKYGASNVEREHEIQHPLGTGHADVLIRPERLLVEIKSTTTGTISTPVFENAVRQLKHYLHYASDVADQGALYMINPSTLKPADVFPVRLTDDDRQEIEDGMANLARAIEDRQTPGRVCSKPSQARGMFCPFAHVCFADWQPDPAEEITSPDALATASDLATIKESERQHREALKALETARKDVQERLGELVPVGDSVVGPYAVKRMRKTRSASFNAKVAAAAGFPVETLAEFYTGGSEWDEYRITKADAAGTTDFGDEAPF